MSIKIEESPNKNYNFKAPFDEFEDTTSEKKRKLEEKEEPPIRKVQRFLKKKSIATDVQSPVKINLFGEKPKKTIDLFGDSQIAPREKKSLSSFKNRQIAPRQLQWHEKKPAIGLGTLTINGTEFPLEKLGEGKYHKVYRFKEDQPLELKNETIRTSNVVLKVLSHNVSVKKIKGTILNTVKGYEHLQNQGIPVPKIHLHPQHFTDTQNPSNGLFWVVEKLPKAITGNAWSGDVTYDALDEESQEILNWAKDRLNEMALSSTDIINDFARRNTMMTEEGEIKIVDFSPPEDDEWSIHFNIASYAKDWANQNPNILAWLTEELPENIKGML